MHEREGMWVFGMCDCGYEGVNVTEGEQYVILAVRVWR